MNKKDYTINFLRSFIAYPLWFIFLPILALIAYPLTFLPKKNRYDNLFYFAITGFMARLFIWTTFLKIRYINKGDLPRYPEQPAIFVANHTSAIDIPLIDSLLSNYPHVWISKDLYGKIPIFGRLVRAMHITINRESPRKAIQALINAIDRVNQKSRHMIIFPEGTRNSDGVLGSFKEGFAIAAEKLNRPVIPVAIKNLHKAFPKGSIICQSFNNQIEVVIGKPMFIKEDESRADFINRVQDWFTITLFQKNNLH